MIPETTPAFVHGILGLLLMTGIPMDIETLKVIATWTAPLIAAVLTYMAAMRKLANDAKTTDIGSLTTRLDNLQNRFDALSTKFDEEREKNNKNSSRIQLLEDNVRDRDELIEDMADHIVHTQEWIEGGSTPPDPVMSWRVKKHLKTRTPTEGQTIIEGT